MAADSSVPADRIVLIIVHEIWGVNDHIRSAARHFGERLGCSVITPSYLMSPFPPEDADEGDAYRSFQETVGIGGMTDRLIHDCDRLRSHFDTVLALGFSVGATAAWLAACQGAVDGAACLYGSRIREHTESSPLSPALVLMAEQETAFDPRIVTTALARLPRVIAGVYDGVRHGFCNPASPVYDASGQLAAYREVAAFFELLAAPVASSEEVTGRR